MKMFRDSPKIITEDPASISLTYAVEIQMEDLLEKLKLLDYDIEFCQELKIKGINRHYFVIPINPGEQFYIFTNLAAWLIKKSGKNFPLPQESDDPNSTISNILEYLRGIDVPIDFPPNKLKQGVGEHVVYVLDNLADRALKTCKFEWKKANIPPDEQISKSEEEELTFEKIEETLDYEEEEEEEEEEEPEEEEEEDIVHVDDITRSYEGNQNVIHKPKYFLESKTDIDEWKLELERVLPQLKITIKTDNRDWRSHLERMKQLQTDIENNLNITTGQLGKLQSEMLSNLDKISTRENYLNQQLNSQLDVYKSLQEELLKLRERYREVSGGVTDRTRVLNKVTEELEHMKKEMDERGSSMTDGTPLVNLKKTIMRMKSEISEMNTRIGVLEYSLMCAKLRDRTQLQEDMISTKTGNNSLLI